jgi:hypothetical protein
MEFHISFKKKLVQTKSYLLNNLILSFVGVVNIMKIKKIKFIKDYMDIKCSLMD